MLGIIHKEILREIDFIYRTVKFKGFTFGSNVTLFSKISVQF
jgi:hypothetical protein